MDGGGGEGRGGGVDLIEASEKKFVKRINKFEAGRANYSGKKIGWGAADCLWKLIIFHTFPSIYITERAGREIVEFHSIHCKLSRLENILQSKIDIPLVEKRTQESHD